MALAPDVDVERYARLTEGYSGADLQALVYNAHLDAVHASIAQAENELPSVSPLSAHAAMAQYAIVGGAADKSILSRAEQAVRDMRVRSNLRMASCHSEHT